MNKLNVGFRFALPGLPAAYTEVNWRMKVKYLSYGKRSRVGCLLLLVAIFFAGCGTKHMIPADIKPTFAAKPDMALLVIFRTTSAYGDGHLFDNYLDGKMIGQTVGKGFFTTDIAPGSHYVMAHAQNWVTARLDFEAGKTYFLNQWVIYSVPTPRTGFAAMAAENALKHIGERGSDYLVYDSHNHGEDMAVPVFEKLRNNFEKEVKEDPARHKDTLEYRGYSNL
jgi:hypothetical protein